MAVNYKQLYAIKKQNKERLLKANKELPNASGIYFLTRTDENGINYFYIGQSVDILDRLISHLSGYQHIDISLKKRGLYDAEKNPMGWKVNFMKYPKDELDKWEQYWILEYTKHGYQCRYNKTSGSQGTEKEKINEFKPARGYRDGLEQGRKNASKEISHLFEKHLIAVYRGDKTPSVNQQKAMQKFDDFLNYWKGDENNATN